MICDFGVFLATVCDDQAVLFTTSGFVDRGVTGALKGGGKFLESIDFLCVSSDKCGVQISFFNLQTEDIGVG